MLCERVAVARVAESLRREVPDDLVPLDIDDEHTVGKSIQRTDDTIEIKDRTSALVLVPERRDRACRVRRRASPESPGDVALGAGVGRLGEDALGGVELDEAARCGDRRRPRR